MGGNGHLYLQMTFLLAEMRLFLSSNIDILAKNLKKSLAVSQKAIRKMLPLGNKADYFRYFVNLSNSRGKSDILQRQKIFQKCFYY